MSQFLVVLICIAAGIGIRRLRQSDGPAIGMALNTVIIYVSLPALAITQIHKMSVSFDMLLAAMIPWTLFLAALAICVMLGRTLGWSRETTGMMILLTGLGNTSFLGFPLIEAVVGKEGLPTAIVTDQLGSFFVVSTLGLIVAGLYSPDKEPRNSFLKKIVFFPPFIATLFALATRSIDPPEELMIALDRIGLTLSPLALMSVGARMEFKRELLAAYKGKVATALLIKMVLIPIIGAVIVTLVTDERDLEQKVMILEAAMPSMITGYLVGAEHKLDAKLGVLVVTCGIALSILTVPLWSWILNASGF